jgi:DNA-binding transcriptional MerR regulator
MTDRLTIGEASRRSGVPAKTIRFYEAEGVVPSPVRTTAGYRVYSPNDVRRLQLARRARLLGMALPEVKALVMRAFSSDCAAYADQVLDVIARQRAVIDGRIAELQALRQELDAVEAETRAAKAGIVKGRMVATCGRCPLIDDTTGAPSACRCDRTPVTDCNP